MNRPRIGIPLTLDDRGRWRAGRDYLYIDRRYAFAIERAGGLPLQLPIQDDAEAAIETLDGLLLPGGDDLPSDRPLPDDARLDLVPESQLAFDRRLFEAAATRRRPILGICYGMQLMALARGGALEAHLPSSDLGAGDHRLPSEGRHPVEVEPDSRLATILGTGAQAVNSLHHQAVRAPGRGHRAVARSPDGVIEAIEAPGEDWEIGVQWHPEKMDDDTSARLFHAFVNACRDAARTGERP